VRVKVFPTADRAARALAFEIARLVATKPTAVLGLPTGRTPIPLYRELIRLHALGRASFARASTFNVDEFVGIPAADPRSYHAFMRQHLFNHVDLPLPHAHFLNGTAEDLDRECVRYERAIERAGGIDLQILGLGANGHIGAPVRKSLARGPSRSAVDGHSDHSAGPPRRAARDRKGEGALRGPDDPWSTDDAAAGVLPAAAPQR
jgi:glucosamine-6-phosphate isomerase